MAQVGYYKATKGADGIGKRPILAPLHHHLEPLAGQNWLPFFT